MDKTPKFFFFLNAYFGSLAALNLEVKKVFFATRESSLLMNGTAAYAPLLSKIMQESSKT